MALGRPIDVLRTLCFVPRVCYRIRERLMSGITVTTASVLSRPRRLEYPRHRRICNGDGKADQNQAWLLENLRGKISGLVVPVRKRSPSKSCSPRTRARDA